MLKNSYLHKALRDTLFCIVYDSGIYFINDPVYKERLKYNDTFYFLQLFYNSTHLFSMHFNVYDIVNIKNDFRSKQYGFIVEKNKDTSKSI